MKGWKGYRWENRWTNLQNRWTNLLSSSRSKRSRRNVEKQHHNINIVISDSQEQPKDRAVRAISSAEWVWVEEQYHYVGKIMKLEKHNAEVMIQGDCWFGRRRFIEGKDRMLLSPVCQRVACREASAWRRSYSKRKLAATGRVSGSA